MILKLLYCESKNFKGIFILDGNKLFIQDDRFKKEIINWEQEKEKPDSRISLPVNYDSGISIAVSGIFPVGENFLVLKDNGCLQLWNARHAEITNRLFINESVSNYRKAIRITFINK